jgi:hypothetical protein
MTKNIWRNRNLSSTLYYKVLFMENKNESLETLRDIKRIMERSSRFISLSGLSGISAGLCALAGAWFAYDHIYEYYNQFGQQGYSGNEFSDLKLSLLVIAAAVLAAALIFSLYFTNRRARQNKQKLWDHTSKRLLMNLVLPLLAGGLFILAMLQQNEWRFVAPACLIFYGLALVNAGKYTLNEVRYLGLLEILLGLINTQYIGYGLYFWAAGFGVLHIIYGVVMWWKYEKIQNV